MAVVHRLGKFLLVAYFDTKWGTGSLDLSRILEQVRVYEGLWMAWLFYGYNGVIVEYDSLSTVHLLNPVLRLILIT